MRDYPADLHTTAARKIIERIAGKAPAMANLTISVLKCLMDYAVAEKLAPSNPIVGFKRYKTGEHHTWTDEEMMTFENVGRSGLWSASPTTRCPKPGNAAPTL
jgi:hypothetical protein